jgi:hypothetical protein
MVVNTSDGQVFASNPAFQCSGLPTGATCSFSPSNLQGMASGTTVTVTVATAGPFTGTAGTATRATAPAKKRAQNEKLRLWMPLTLPLAGVVFVGFFGRRPYRRCMIATLCLTLVLAAFLVACGGSSSTPITVSVSPATVNTLFPSLAGAPTQQATFTANVTGASNPTITWAAGGVTGGNSTVGTISGTGPTATYTAPATLPSPAAVSITATVSGATSPGAATVNLQTPTPAGTSSVTITATEGPNTPQTTTFSLTVN